MKILVLLLMYVIGAQAIVTIAPIDIGKKPGFSGVLKGSLGTKRGNTESDTYSSDARIQYDNNSSYVVWNDISFHYARASGTTNTNKTYAHMRYIHIFYKKELQWEAFVQSQTDKFTKIQKRLLSGIGLRYHADLKKSGNVYFGFGSFFEHIDYTTKTDGSKDNARLNIYIAYKNQLAHSVRLSYIGYYQPRVALFHDAFLSNAAELKVQIYKQLSMTFELTYNQNTEPAIGVQKYDFAQKTSFVYDF